MIAPAPLLSLTTGGRSRRPGRPLRAGISARRGHRSARGGSSSQPGLRRSGRPAPRVLPARGRSSSGFPCPAKHFVGTVFHVTAGTRWRGTAARPGRERRSWPRRWTSCRVGLRPDHGPRDAQHAREGFAVGVAEDHQVLAAQLGHFVRWRAAAHEHRFGGRLSPSRRVLRSQNWEAAPCSGSS